MVDAILPPNIPAPPKPMKKLVNVSKALSAVEDELNQVLNLSGQSSPVQVKNLVSALASTIQQAVLDGKLSVLPYVREQVMGQLNRASLGYMARQKELTATTVVVTLSQIIKANNNV